jgi:Domain of unknown function (DUF3786)
MELVPIKIAHGEEKAWETLAKLVPEDICNRASETYDRETGLYRIKSFGIPIDVKGGQRFFAGTQVLPLNQIAEKYANDRDGFLKKGWQFSAEVLDFADASVRLYPLPRVPVTLILWLEDEEFPPRADLLFDSTCGLQIVLSDIIWSIAMMSSLVMLYE